MSPENGFEIRAVLLHETIPGGSWHLVADPEKVGGQSIIRIPSNVILTIAKRTAIRDIFAKPPQQSDYLVEWAASRIQPRKRALIRRVLGKIKRVTIRVLKRHGQLVYNPQHYRLLSEQQVWRGNL